MKINDADVDQDCDCYVIDVNVSTCQRLTNACLGML